MEVDDKVVLAKTKSNSNCSFWRRKNIDYDSLGTVMSVSSRVAECTFVSVQWDNSAISICDKKHLKPFEDKNTSLPNLRFKRRAGC